MEFLMNLKPNTLIALVSFCAAKGCGLLAIIAMVVDRNIAAVLGACWALGILLSIVYSIKAWKEVVKD